MLTGQGLSASRAAQAVDLQGAIASSHLLAKLHAAMGGEYAGAWFAPAAAKLQIGVTSPTGRRAAERAIARAGLTAHTTLTAVRSSMRQLVATQERWNRKLAALFAHDAVTTRLEPQRNMVSVTLSSTVPPRQRAALEREASGADVHVSVTASASPRIALTPAALECNLFTEGANCERSVTAGVKIENPRKCVDTGVRSAGSSFYESKAECERFENSGVGEWKAVVQSCTAGPAAIPANRKARVLLTAGHCIDESGGEKEAWYAFNRAGAKSLIGEAANFVDGGPAGAGYGDFGEIKIEAGGGWQTGNAKVPVYAVSAEWQETGETRYPVKGEQLAIIGASSCHEGAKSGQSCGLITAYNLTIADETSVAEGLVEVIEPVGAKLRLIGEFGDSGGPWLAIETNNEVLMEGTFEGLLLPSECNKVVSSVGRQYFRTRGECEDYVTFKEMAGNEGEWERRLRLAFDPLKRPPETTAKGSLEYLELELLTTANESRAKELEEEEAKEKEHKEEKGKMVLPEFLTSTSWTGTSGAGKLTNSGAKTSISCTSGTSSGSMESSKKLGAFAIAFKGCTGEVLGSKVKCESTGDASETVLSTGTWHLVLTIVGATHRWEVWFLVQPLAIKCTALAKVEVKGNVLGAITPTATKTKHYTITLATASGAQEYTYFENDSGEDVSAQLLSNINGGTFSASTEESKEDKIELSAETEVVN